MKTITTLVSILLLLPSFAVAHRGGLDKSGCHHDRKNGGYHCHNGGVPTQSPHTSTNSVNTNSAKPQSLKTKTESSTLGDTNLAAHKDLVFKIQSALNQRGYLASKPDGVLDEQTIKAIKHFQVDNDMAVDGKASYLLLEVLLGKV
ncbi:MAG TPA: peptidoglycan-binding protein [Cellvibrio sp.]|nr:peptidoglycan-binding protein [Cellvibrio sp.]